MQNYLYQQFIVNWRTTLVGIIGAVAAGVGSYLSAGNHVNFTGIGLASAIALLGVVFKDVNQGPLGIINGLIVKHGESAVLDYLNAALKKETLAAFVLICLVVLGVSHPAIAQTGINIGSGVSADAVHFRGAWTAGSTISQFTDVKDSAASANGYVDSYYALAQERLYSGAGFNSYLTGVQVVPTKLLNSLIGSTNIPSDSVQISARALIGATVPSAGGSRVTGGVGVSGAIALNQSGSIVWKTVDFSWQNPGVITVTSGVQFILGGPTTVSAQSSKAARLRRALLSK